MGEDARGFVNVRWGPIMRHNVEAAYTSLPYPFESCTWQGRRPRPSEARLLEGAAAVGERRPQQQWPCGGLLAIDRCLSVRCASWAA